MASDRPKASREDADQAIRAIRDYHKEGRKSLREQPERGRHGAKQIEAEAERLGWNPTKLRDARMFAHPVEGYSRERLDELFQLLREHRPVFGVTHAAHLASVPLARREEIQRRCIESNWSRSKLKAEIKRLLGRRKQGGRRRKVSSDPGEVLVQLDVMADTWQRWFRQVADEEEARPILNRLPSKVREQVHEVDAAMSGLREAVAARLAALRRKANQASN
jgi:hypothetical protein